MTTDYQGQSERVILLQRLISQKDSLLKASQEIEELFYQYRVAGESDPTGELEKEVWKRLHLIIAVLSELISYSNAGKNFMRTLIVGLNSTGTLGIMKGPIVSFKDMSVFRNLIGGLPG
jgi:hypothetical protein